MNPRRLERSHSFEQLPQSSLAQITGPMSTNPGLSIVQRRVQRASARDAGGAR